MKVQTHLTLIQYAFNNVGRTEHLVQQSVECMLRQKPKPFKRAFKFLIIMLIMQQVHVLVE